MSKRKREGEDYKEKISKKRAGKKKDEAGPSGLCGSITVQRLSANVSDREPAKDKCSSMTIENRPKIAKSSIAASVPLSKMLKLGKVIVPGVDIVTLSLEEFSITEMKWLEPIQATFSLERKSFASGGFRDAYLAKAISGIAKRKYVLKR